MENIITFSELRDEHSPQLIEDWKGFKPVERETDKNGNQLYTHHEIDEPFIWRQIVTWHDESGSDYFTIGWGFINRIAIYYIGLPLPDNVEQIVKDPLDQMLLLYPWKEVSFEVYENAMEVLPPRVMHGMDFMTSEPLCMMSQGFVYEVFVKYKDRYFCRNDYSWGFNPERYEEEIEFEMRLGYFDQKEGEDE